MKTTGYILNGIYYDDEDLQKPSAESDSITYKVYDHDRQRENHRRDLIQPWVNGKLNPEFVEQYPEEAKQYGFNQK